MAFRLSNITDEEALKGCSQTDLAALLATDAEFIIPKKRDGQIDCKKLVDLFFVPQKLPVNLANALYYIDEMSTKDAADHLQTAFELKYPDFICAPAPVCSVGCAIKAWLKDADLVKRVLAENSVENIQATDVFRGPPEKGRKAITKTQVAALQKSLVPWFAFNRRGSQTEITRFDRDGVLWFIVRRGDAFKREAQINQDTGASEASFGYKELHDIIIYDPEANDLQIHADGTKIKQQYSRVFGEILFGDVDFFVPGAAYTLEPLLQKKSGALNYGGIANLNGARLVRIEYPVGNDQNEMVAHKSDDLLASFGGREATLTSTGVHWDSITCLSQATIKLDFGQVDGVQIGVRSVRICPPRRVLYKRDGAAPLIEQFLRNNQFILDKEETPDVAGAL